jgi:hypothetical protein
MKYACSGTAYIADFLVPELKYHLLTSESDLNDITYHTHDYLCLCDPKHIFIPRYWSWTPSQKEVARAHPAPNK